MQTRLMKQSVHNWVPLVFIVTLLWTTLGFSPQSPQNSTPQQGASGNVNSSTVMVLDTSGSMDESDITGMTKLEAAQNAASNILDVIATEAQQSTTVISKVGLVNFNASTQVNSTLTTDYNNIWNEIQGLYAGGGTGMADGLQNGVNLFSSTSTFEKRIIILLSDGQPNIPLDNNIQYDELAIQQEVIDISSMAGGQGICVYTIGFGVPDPSGYGSINEDFLKNVAAASGCGAYYNALNAIELANIFIELRHVSMGEIVYRKSGSITQGQELDLGSVPIATNQELALFTVNGLDSTLELIVKDPSGTTVDQNYPGATLSVSPSITSLILSNPKPGDWYMRIRAANVPNGTTAFNTIVSTRMGVFTPTPLVVPTQVPTAIPVVADNGLSTLIIFLVLAGIILGIFIYAQIKNRERTRGSRARLVGTNGEFAGHTIIVGDGFTIGRTLQSNLRLNDLGVSRSHAQFRYSNGGWFLQDMGSSRGTFVNGKRVSAARLIDKDQIQIGSNSFVFNIGDR